jgi:hypothetical protein
VCGTPALLFCVLQAAGDATFRAHLHRSSCALLRVRTAWSGSVLSEHLQSTTEAWLVQSSPQELAPLFDTTASDDPWKVCCAHLWHKPTHTQTNVTAEDGRTVQGSLARHFSNVSCVSSQSAATSTVSSPAPSPSGRSPANSAECALASRLAMPQSLGAFALSSVAVTLLRCALYGALPRGCSFRSLQIKSPPGGPLGVLTLAHSRGTHTSAL